MVLMRHKMKETEINLAFYISKLGIEDRGAIKPVLILD
jgi:hypothetical protein